MSSEGGFKKEIMSNCKFPSFAQKWIDTVDQASRWKELKNAGTNFGSYS